MAKKSQSAAGAAGLIALLAVFIVLYLLLLPPQERADLLGDQPSSGLGSGKVSGSDAPFTINKTSLSVSPGRIEYLKFSEYDHPLPAVTLFTKTNADILAKESSIYTKNGIFDFQSKNMTFKIADLEFTDNVMLSATTSKASGMLRVYLNGMLFYEGVADPFPVLSIDKEMLQPLNILSFEVSPVGWKFWTTNEYLLQDVKVTADVQDVSEQASKLTFIVTDSEKFNLEKAALRFFPDCNPNAVGKLKVFFNNQNVYTSIPDCSQLNMIDLSPDVFSAGINDVTFKTDKGMYSLYQVNVHTDLKKQTYPVYYFEVDDRLFIGEEDDSEASCGEIDGICPTDCDEDLDKDCCLDGANMYWCDVAPDEEGDRCVSAVNSNICPTCATGYEDDNGKASEACKGLCGDDKDNKCPSGCSKYYDKDCCFDESTDNYWCDDVPIYGLNTVCKNSLSSSQCKECPSDYKTETGESYSCDEEESLDINTLRSDFKVELKFKFIGEDKKAANVYVNGHKFYLDTFKGDYTRDISNFVEPGSNAVKIEPSVGTLDIVEMKIEVTPK